MKRFEHLKNSYQLIFPSLLKHSFMKNYLLILFFLLAGMASHAQNILRVNNNVGVNAPYTTISAAIAAAGVNDIVMLEGSITNYGSVTINKKVTIVGPGYFLAENQNLQATIQPALIGAVVLNNGASGSSFSGLSFTDTFTINAASNVSLTQSNFVPTCFSRIILTGAAINNRISGNYIPISTCGNDVSINANGATHTGTIISNNFCAAGVFLGSTSIFTIANNILGGTNISGGGGNMQNSVIQNNIFTGSISDGTGSIIKNNVFVSPQTGLDPTNLVNQPLASLFVGLVGNTTDTQWRLKVGSPATGVGVASADCGIYGGATPYRPSGIIAGQPTITNFVSPASVSQNGTLNVKVSAKVN
jgi:hypothetical protein